MAVESCSGGELSVTSSSKPCDCEIVSLQKHLFPKPIQRRGIIPVVIRDVGLREDVLLFLDDDDVVHEGEAEPLDALAALRDAAQGARRVRHRAREEEVGAGQALLRHALPPGRGGRTD